MTDQLKTKITVDADDAVRDLNRTTAETREYADETTRAGDKTDQASTQIKRTGSSLRGLRDSVSGMVTSWLSFTAIVGTIVAGFREIAGSARDALKAVVDLGKNIRGLSANVGGKVADEVVSDINQISLTSGFDVGGRNELIAAIAAQTDVNPDLGRAELRKSAERLAQLQRATGVGGSTGFETVQSLEATFGLTQQQAVDQAAVLLNSGLGASTIQDLAEKAGPVGGQELFARLLAARGEVNLGRAGRSLPTLISALTRRGTDGELADELTGVGITEDQTITERIDLLGSLSGSGRITQGQFEQAIGGAQNLRLFAPLVRASARQDEARQALLTGTAVEETQKLRQSQFVQIAERQQQRELREKLAEENGAGAGLVEGFEDFQIELAERGRGSTARGALASLTGPGTQNIRDTDALQASLDNVGVSPFGGQGQPPQIIVENHYHGQVINGHDPNADLLRGIPRGGPEEMHIRHPR